MSDLIDFVKPNTSKRVNKIFQKAIELSRDEQNRILERSKNE